MSVEQDLNGAAGGAEEFYGCLFCRSSGEDKVIRELAKGFPEMTMIAPEKLRHRRTGRDAVEERVKLFPGYIFFRTADGSRLRELTRSEDVYKVLRNGEGEWRLAGSDLEIAKSFFRVDGLVGFSRAYYEGDRIRIVDGFMKQHEGSIIRVNRRAKTAEIRIEFQDKLLSMWLGFELIEPSEPDRQASDQKSEQG